MESDNVFGGSAWPSIHQENDGNAHRYPNDGDAKYRRPGRAMGDERPAECPDAPDDPDRLDSPDASDGLDAPSDLELRRYDPNRPADADEVWRVHEEALRASAIEFVPDAPADEDLREIADRYLDSGGEFLVRTVAGEVVAVGGFVPVEGEVADDDNDADRANSEEAAELRRIRVHPDHQRNGYGEEVVAELERRAVEREFDLLVLETNEHLTAARRLYEERGYEQVGSETNPVTGDEIVRYRKPL